MLLLLLTTHTHTLEDAVFEEIQESELRGRLEWPLLFNIQFVKRISTVSQGFYFSTSKFNTQSTSNFPPLVADSYFCTIYQRFWELFN